MTTHTFDGMVPAFEAKQGLRTISWSPFGWYTRYMLGAYFRHAMIVIAALLTVALMLDVSPRVERLLADAPHARGIWAITHVGYYILIRMGDMIVPLLPIGCFLGTLWCEVTHTVSRERLMVWNSGRSPFQCVLPVLIFGLVMGVGMFSIEAVLRPWIMSVQAAQRLGEHGVRLSRDFSPARRWIAAGDDLVNTVVEFGPPATMYDLTIYRMGSDGRVAEVISARSAKPGKEPNMWLAHDVHIWKATPRAQGSSAGSGAAGGGAAGGDGPPSEEREATGTEERLLDMELSLQINPLWLTNLGIEAKYLSNSVLFALANPRSGTYPRAEYRSWVQVRLAQLILPAGMALLATSFSLWLLAYGTRNEVLLGIALAGYIAHVVMKAVLLMGENDYLPPVIAGWFTPLMLWAVSGSLLVLITRRGFESPFAIWKPARKPVEIRA